MNFQKRVCVLQVTPEAPNPKHVELFHNKTDCDFFFVTHDSPHKDALQFCPNTTWTDTRNILAAKVTKNYEYYAFVDYDYIFRPLGELGVLEQILHDLEKYNPAVLTFYPGNGMTTPFAANVAYRDSKDYSILPFSHCGLKIIHHSLLKWFFPMVTRFGGGVEACHLFNILEIPFLKNVVCSHQMVYDNGVTDFDAPHNQDGAWNDYCMNEMWKWIKPSFKKNNLLDSQASSNAEKMSSLLIKKVFQNIFVTKNIQPLKSGRVENYFDRERIEKFFNFFHERFQNFDCNLGAQLSHITSDDMGRVTSRLTKIEFADLNVQENPWIQITADINKEIKESRKLTTSEVVEMYQKAAGSSLFYNSHNKDPRLEEFLKDKRVAFVGPAPYLNGSGKGALIDSYDVVVRIQHGIPNIEDYGSRTDVVQSCLNSNYGPPLVRYLESIPPEQRPDFVICNDTASQQKRDGSWALVDEIYESIFENLSIPFVHLKNQDSTWDRWGLYWEIYAKQHIEKFAKGSYTIYSANFNSGYGALNVLLGYPLRELAVFGVDFYNTGIPQNDAQKYNNQYTSTYGASGTPNGPDKILHDQVSQIMHCKNVLLRDSRFKLDEPVLRLLNQESINSRINKIVLLPKFKNETR